MKKILPCLVLAALCGPAHAQQDTIEVFRFGVLGGPAAAERRAAHACLADAMEQALGVPTEVFAPADYTGMVEGLLGGGLDMAWLGASAYAAAQVQRPGALTPVLVGVNAAGAIGYHAVAVARADSGIAGPRDMAGKTLGASVPGSVSGYLIAAIEMSQALGAPLDSGAPVAAVVFTGGHAQTLSAVATGAVDAGLTWVGATGAGPLRDALDTGAVAPGALVEIWRSAVVPEGPVVLRGALPEAVKVAATEVMDSLHQRAPECAAAIAPHGTVDFQPVTADAYRTVIAVHKARSGG